MASIPDTLSLRVVLRVYFCMALAVLLSLAITAGSPTYEECYAGQQEHHGTSATEEPQNVAVTIGRWWRCQWVAINENEGIVIGLFTAALVVATVLLWLATLKLARDADLTSRRSLRAYVGITEAKRIDVQNHRQFVAQVMIENSGQTPAYDLTAWAWIELAVNPLSKSLDPAKDKDKNQSRSTIGPRRKIFLRVNYETPLSDADILGLQQGKLGLYLYGNIQYRDAFGRTQGADFSFVCTALGFSSDSFAVQPDGNHEHSSED
jgi:hypothetical protein